MSKIELEEGQTLTAHDIDGIYRAIKAEIRGAEDKRGEEVLEMAKQIIRDNSSNWGALTLDEAYKERFGKPEVMR